jgi:hypothetical protein
MSFGVSLLRRALMMKNFSGTEFGNKAVGFDEPTQLPQDDVQRRAGWRRKVSDAPTPRRVVPRCPDAEAST